MSLRNHRDERSRKRHKARMPAPSQAKLGTKVHESERYPEDNIDVDKCAECESFIEVAELEEFNGICFKCSQVPQYDKEDSDEVSDV